MPEEDANPSEKLTEKAIEEATGLVKRIFGPPADEIGLALAKRFKEREERKALERQIRNLERTAANADRKTKVERRREPVSPRVAKKLLEEAAFAENEVLTEYIGGILASSRELGNQDDTMVECVDLISRLPSRALRVHYLIYRSILELQPPHEMNFYDENMCVMMQSFLDGTDISAALELDELQDGDSTNELNNAVLTLGRAGLVAETYGGGGEFMQKQRGLPRRGMVITPTSYGAQLYLTAFGYGHVPVNNFFTMNGDELTIARIPRVRGKKVSDIRNGKE